MSRYKRKQIRLKDIVQLKRYALWKLGQGEVSVKKMTEKLNMYAEDAKDVVKVLEYLLEHGYLDDERFCRSKVRGCVSSNKGPKYIRAKMFEYGVSSGIVETVMEELAAEDPFVESAELVASKFKLKYPTPLCREHRQKEIKRLVSKLAGKGFTADVFRIATNAIDSLS